MAYLGDFRLGDTFDCHFTTRQISGAPSTLSSSPVISAYVGNSTTQLTAGITLDVDFDAVTGLNHIRVVASNGNGYATASNYSLVITTGTVNSVSVVGEVIHHFSIEARSALMPTTAARTLAVDASGRALSDVDTIKTNPVVNGGTITFPTTATLASTTNITAGTITTATNLTNAPTSGDLTAAMKTSVTTAATAATPTAAAVTGSVGSVTGLTASNLDATISSRLASASYVSPTTALTESYAALHAAPTTAQILFEIRGLLAEKSVSSTTLTMNKIDGSTAAETFTLNSATVPTAITRSF